MTTEREEFPFDVLFVGGGPACLASAIHLMEKAQQAGLELEVGLIEKGAEIGAHAVSGAIVNPIALSELMPDHLAQGCPVEATVKEDAFYFLTREHAFRVPFVPAYMRNGGYYIVSLSRLTRWLGEHAEALGVNIFPGFAGTQTLLDPTGRKILGVRTGDKGIDKEGNPKSNFEAGIDLTAKVTVFGEGARGSLAKALTRQLGLDEGAMPQVYETGIKEVIQLPESNYFSDQPVNDIHFLGYPLDLKTPGGGFCYAMGDNRISIGYLTGLAYEDPLIDPYEALVKFKQHPFIARLIADGKVIEQGARTVTSGGLFTLPKLAVDGGLFVGGSAAMQNMPTLKGIHLSMKSGMLAAETIIEAFQADDYSIKTLARYPERLLASWVGAELKQGRNFSQALAKPPLLKLIHLGAQYLTRGKGLTDPMPISEDSRTLRPLQTIPTQKRWSSPPSAIYDNQLTVDKLTGVYLSKTIHREDQPSHLLVRDLDLCSGECYRTYQNPCTRFCPGNVYEIIMDEETKRPKLKLNPSNCFHCKTCDIKDPYQNISWTCPEGGDGPGYRNC